MKLIPGTNDVQSFLYNCTRNKSCQKEWFVPIRQISDLMFFVDLPGKPDLIEITFNDICCVESIGGDFDPDEFSDDFFIGGQIGCPFDAVSNSYIVGQKPSGEWYGVFSNFTVPDLDTKKFYVHIKISIGEDEYNFYSQQIEIEEDCDPLLYLQGCYPNVTSGDAEDCNGVYYGFHQGPDEHLGTLNFRYFHWAYVRGGAIFDNKVKLNFTAFNSKKTYRAEIDRDKMLEFEMVPEFYKDHLFGIFLRGNIRANGVEYRLLEQQEFSPVSMDSRFWQLDIGLTEYCKNTFGCGVSDCTLPPDPVPEDCDTPSTVNVFEIPEPNEASATLEHNGNPNMIPVAAEAEFFPNFIDFVDVPLGGSYEAGDNIHGVKFARVFQTGGILPALPHNPVASRIRYKDDADVIQTLDASLRLVAPTGLGDFQVEVVMFTDLPLDFVEFYDFSFTYDSGTVSDELDYKFIFVGGTPLLSGQLIEWEIYDDADNLLYSGQILSEPLEFIIERSEDFDLDTMCITVRWRKKCSSLSWSDWQEKGFGTCCESIPCEIELTPVEDMVFGLFSGDGCELPEFESIIWKIEQDDVIIDEGAVFNLMAPFLIEGVDLDSLCYVFSWRRQCLDDTTSAWNVSEWGNCPE